MNLNAKKDRIIRNLSQAAAEVFPNGEGNAFLFGSQARGDNSDESDWDILVLTAKKVESQKDFDTFVSPFAEIGWLMDVEINPIQYSMEEWNHRKGSLFYDNVMRDAIKL